MEFLTSVEYSKRYGGGWNILVANVDRIRICAALRWNYTPLAPQGFGRIDRVGPKLASLPAWGDEEGFANTATAVRIKTGREWRDDPEDGRTVHPLTHKMGDYHLVLYRADAEAAVRTLLWQFSLTSLPIQCNLSLTEGGGNAASDDDVDLIER